MDIDIVSGKFQLYQTQWWRENHFTILVAWLNSLVLIEIVQNHSSRVFVYLRFSQNKVYLMTAGTVKLAKFDHFDLLNGIMEEKIVDFTYCNQM